MLVTATTVALTQVSQSIRVQPRGDSRLPDTNMIDISVKKIFRIGRYACRAGDRYLQRAQCGADPAPDRPARHHVRPPEQDSGAAPRAVRSERDF